VSPMDHAAAHERIEELLLDPARLADLERSALPEDAALREHLDGCPACRGDLESWRTLERRVAESMPAGADARAALAVVEPIDVPPSLRARVAAAVGSAERPGILIGVGRGSRSPARGLWLGLAASLVLAVASLAVAVDQANRQAVANTESEALATALVAVDRVLAAPHKVVELRGADGAAAGSISWSRHDWVVLTSALMKPPAGQAYECWLEDGQRSVPVGSMDFAGGSAFWVATVDDWQTWEIGPNTDFVVSLEADGATTRSGQIVLSADLGS
jgi:Anti-sigma-K factor rskA